MTDIAYVFSHDGDEHGIKFGVTLCTEDTLRAEVQKHLDPGGERMEEFEANMTELLEKGAVDFEDGWIVIKRGTAEIVDFLIYQLREAVAEEKGADQRRYEELKRRETAEARFAVLQSALLDALGPKAPEIAAKAAA